MEKTISKIAAILCLALAAALCGCDLFEYEEEKEEFDGGGYMHKHAWGEEMYMWEYPTCVSTGSACRICITCGQMDYNFMIEIPIDPDGHYWQSTGVIEPTCTQPGKDIQTCAYQECTSTDTNEIDIPALGHERHIAYPPILEPTCTGLGIEIESCIRPGCEAPDPQEISIPAIGHDRYLYETLSLPKCVLPGKAIYHCYRNECEEPDIEGDIDALGHDGQMSITLEPTCTGTGIETESCVRSGCEEPYLGEVEIAALGHNREIISRTLEETCTTSGKGTEACSRPGCEEPDPQYITIRALGHDRKLSGRENPTCTKTGREGYICGRRGCNFEEIVTLSATGHSYKYEIFLVASCLLPGQGRDRCTVCDNTANYKKIEAKGHDWKRLNIGYSCRRCLLYSLNPYRL